MKTERNIALLRGVNVGGKATVKMSALAKAIEELGYTEVKTFLNSGNVLFDTTETDEGIVSKAIEEKLEKEFGRKIQIVLRTQEYMTHMKEKDPYASYDQTDAALYFLVVFLAETPSHEFRLPHEDTANGLTIANVSGREIYLVLDRKRLAETGDAMRFITKNFPGLSTTRTWKTVMRLTTL